jgi:hypothetical protein
MCQDDHRRVDALDSTCRDRSRCHGILQLRALTSSRTRLLMCKLTVMRHQKAGEAMSSANNEGF